MAFSNNSDNTLKSFNDDGIELRALYFFSGEISTMLLKLKQKHMHLNNHLKTAIGYRFEGNNMLFMEFKLL